MESLYLIRHAEPALTGVMLGQLDPPLSHAGRLHASATLPALSVEHVWTSPLRRASETATYITAPCVTELSELREIDQGEWTGKTWPEIEVGWPELARNKLVDWLATPAPGGEPWTVFLARVQSAWSIVKAAPSPAAIVAHQGVNAALLYLIEGRDPLQFTQAYGEIIHLEYD